LLGALVLWSCYRSLGMSSSGTASGENTELRMRSGGPIGSCATAPWLRTGAHLKHLRSEAHWCQHIAGKDLGCQMVKIQWPNLADCAPLCRGLDGRLTALGAAASGSDPLPVQRVLRLEVVASMMVSGELEYEDQDFGRENTQSRLRVPLDVAVSPIRPPGPVPATSPSRLRYQQASFKEEGQGGTGAMLPPGRGVVAPGSQTTAHSFAATRQVTCYCSRARHPSTSASS
jgi:hypothetical protein